MSRTVASSTGKTATSLALLLVAFGACAKHDASTPASGADSAAPATTSASATPENSTMPTDITPVRGALASVSDTALTVTTATGDVTVAVTSPLHVFQRAKSDLSHVTSKSFVGVTSVKQPDGSQVATEIHIFPEDLRGTGEGSYLMTPPAGSKDSSRSTMTNGTVGSTSKASEAPRMTNGAVASKNGETMTVDYHGGSQTISVPAGVSVMEIEPSSEKLAKGTKVVVLAKKQPDGSMKASSLVLAAPPK
ncbi:MAG: hypothetical protein M3Y30_06640 [Gemmatimonadota bacterium]|nr:hypothetical protein [Gemmatimonadota bacterium]